MSRTKRLTAFTASYGQAAMIFPYVVVAPAYFAKKIQLGDMMQTGSAFASVQDALSFFVAAYRTIAEWRAIVARLDGFEMSVATAANLPAHAADDRAHAGRRQPTIALEKLCVYLPNGTPLVAADGFAIQRGGARARDRAVGLRQVDAVPRHRRHLAVRHRHHRHPGEGEADDAAAAPLFPDRRAEATR